jgi:hypothetical protein
VTRAGYRHEALIYGSDDDLLAFAVPFLSEGVTAGVPTLLRLNQRQERLVLDALGDSSKVGLLSLDLLHRPASVLRATRALLMTLAQNAPDVRVLGEIPHEPWPAWTRYEAAANHAFGPIGVWGVCPYDARTTSDDVLADVERTHPLITRPGGRRGAPSPRYQDPAEFLAERARLDADPLEATPPDVELTDPSPEHAAEAVEGLAEATPLSAESASSLRFAVAQIVRNAIVHGRPPIQLRLWGASDRIVANVADRGPGPADPFAGLVPASAAADPDEANSLHLIHEALADVSLIRGAHVFTVRLVQR